ncbi:MAG: flippase-like domain-containing protein [Calditrichaceae bacterium]|nr:flippase-like domain-containing protein [Calditrichaceae bacterium]MBN2707699.1 flippase-like domain-containing protein [Calditrichaceae bacterium]
MKEKIVFILKYVFGFGLLIWLFTRFDTVEIFAVMISFDWYIIGMLLVLVFLNIYMQFYRWQYLVSSHSTDYQVKDLLPSFFAGFALRMMIPGGYAEVSKVLLMPGKKRGKVVAFGLEKYFETYIKLMLVLFALPFVIKSYSRYFWILTILGVAAYFAFPRLLRTKYLIKLQEKDIKYHGLFFKTLLFTILIFSLLMAQYALLLNNLGHLELNKTIVAVIFIWGGGLIPVTVSGVGVRENLAVYFLGQYGIPAETAVGVSLLIFFLNALVPAAIGMVFIIRKRKELKTAGSDFRQATKKILTQFNENRKIKKAQKSVK